MRAWEDRIRARLSVVHSRSATGGPLRSPVLELLVEVGLAARAYCLRVADTTPSPLAAVLRAYGERTRSMFDDSPSQRVLDNAPPRRLLPRQILIARVHTRRPAVILEKHVPGVADAVELCKGVSIDLNLVFV